MYLLEEALQACNNISLVFNILGEVPIEDHAYVVAFLSLQSILDLGGKRLKICLT